MASVEFLPESDSFSAIPSAYSQDTECLEMQVKSGSEQLPASKNEGFIMRALRLFAVGTLALLAAACGPDASKQDTGLVVGAVAGGLLGNQFGKGGGNVAATAAGAIIGGIVGSEIGRSMDQQDRMLAQQAEYDALERGQSGVPRSWRNPENGRYGEFTPSRPYRRGADDCRDYTHTIYIDGRPQTMRGTACRNGDGTWRNVA